MFIIVYNLAITIVIIAYLFVEPRVGDLVKPLAERHVIVVLFGEFEQYARGCPGHRVRSSVVHLLAYGRRLLQVQLVAGRDEECALGQKVSRVGELGQSVVIVVAVVVIVVMVAVPATAIVGPPTAIYRGCGTAPVVCAVARRHRR